MTAAAKLDDLLYDSLESLSLPDVYIRLRGVMAVAPLHGDPDPAFASLREISRRLQADVPGATWVSAGMSGDLEAAIRHGATHVRVGSAILGKRPTPR